MPGRVVRLLADCIVSYALESQPFSARSAPKTLAQRHDGFGKHVTAEQDGIYNHQQNFRPNEYPLGDTGEALKLPKRVHLCDQPCQAANYKVLPKHLHGIERLVHGLASECDCLVLELLRCRPPGQSLRE